MVTKGIILSIDLNGNTCEVRMPFFETAGNDPITGTAIISNTPGSYNGYKVGDAVLVGFEDGLMHKPVILGKLYLGVAAEKADPRGVINVESLATDKAASLPADTKLTASIDTNVPNTTVPYSSLSSVANELNSLNTNVGQMDRFINNQFKSIIEDTEGLSTRIEQNAAKIELEAQEIWPGGDTTQRSNIEVNADAIANSVVHITNDGEYTGMSWELTPEGWRIYAKDNPAGQDPRELDIVNIDRGGMYISGDLKIKGYTEDAITLFAQNDSNDEWPDTFRIDTTDPIPSTIEGYLHHYVKVTRDATDYYFWIDQKYIDRYNATIEHSDNPYNVQPGITESWNLNEYSDGNITGWYPEGSAPTWQDGKFIWRWDRTYRYNYNQPSGGQEGYWVYTYVENIICITGATGGQGEPAVSYWLNFETPVHLGKNQDTDIIVTAFKKIGTGIIEGEHEQHDTLAYLRYYWEGDAKPAWPALPNYQIIIRAEVSGVRQFEDKDLIIEATHNPNETSTVKIYDKETITYAPLDKPVLDLDNDTAAIVYYGNEKLSADVTSTAQVYLGTNTEAATYSWSLVGCTGTGTNTATVTIIALTANSATATVTATCTNLLDEAGHNVQLTKVFTITKQLSAAQYWLNASNPVHCGTLQQSDIVLTPMMKIGDEEERAEILEADNAYVRYHWGSDPTSADTWHKGRYTI